MKRYNLRAMFWFSDEGIDISLEANTDEEAINECKKYITSPDFYNREDVNPDNIKIISVKRGDKYE